MQDLRFKFRVWKGLENRMVDNVTYLNPLLLDESLSEETKHNVIMQCTGLKDKKGELVYFNDFIKLDDGIVCIIKQIEDINDIEYGRVVAIPVFCLGKKYQTQYIPTIIAEGEKVGNFYENPELLESEVE